MALVRESAPAAGEHVVKRWKTVKAPSCSEEGLQEGTCTLCSETIQESLGLLDHVDDGKWVVISGASETGSGLRGTHCKKCGAVLQTESFNLSTEEKNAIRSARDYLRFMAFSRKGLIEQLEFEGYSKDAATIAVDSIDVDWFEQAAKSAESYLSFMAFSRSSLISQLEFEGFTHDQAVYGAEQNGY